MRVVEGRAWVRGHGLLDCCVGFEGQYIIRVAKVLRGEQAHLRLPHDQLLLPGALDLHVHFREPGATRKEDFGTGTAAAACGGVTTLVDMPNDRPPTDSRERFASKLELVATKARVDFGLYGLAGPATTAGDDFEAFDRAVTGWKVYPYGLTAPAFRASVARLLERGSPPVVVHAEHPKRLGPGTPVHKLEEHTAHREGAERAALELLVGLDDPRLHLAHLSGAASLKLLGGRQSHSDERYLNEGAGGRAPAAPPAISRQGRYRRATCEVTPHHLLLATKMEALGLFGKCDPPLQRRSDNAALWEALRQGRIDCVASDHAPHLIEEKEGPQPPSGMPGVETMVPLMLQAVRERRWELGRAVEALCELPARRLGLEGLKGALVEGAHADMLVVDLKHPVKIGAEQLHSRCGWSPFEGWPACFPQRVWNRGELVAEAGDCTGRRGRGRYLETFRDQPAVTAA